LALAERLKTRRLIRLVDTVTAAATYTTHPLIRAHYAALTGARGNQARAVLIEPVTSSGPIVVPLAAPDATGVSSGCVSADPELIKAIRQNPEAYYVNVHNADFPAGALRGQLSK
jgi:hypothetical protein